jgi:hypothetical protein
MSIIIKHGAGVEARGYAYGAAAQAEWARQQKEKQKEEEKKAGKLGDIGSYLQIGGAAASFIPGVGPLIGAGLSIAGGTLGAMSGGKGEPGLKAAAAGAQGIASIYQSQKEKIEARQGEFDDWQKRADYTKEVAAQADAQELAKEMAATKPLRNQLIRDANAKHVSQVRAILDDAGVNSVAQLKNHPQAADYFTAITRVDDTLNNTLDDINARWENDPIHFQVQALREQEQELNAQRKQADAQLKNLQNSQKAAQNAAAKRANLMQANLSKLTDVQKQISEDRAVREGEIESAVRAPLEPEALDALLREESNLNASTRQILHEEEEVIRAGLRAGDIQLATTGMELWLRFHQQELVIARNLGPTDIEELYECQAQAKKEFEKMQSTDEGSAILEQKIVELLSRYKYGLGMYEFSK